MARKMRPGSRDSLIFRIVLLLGLLISLTDSLTSSALRFLDPYEFEPRPVFGGERFEPLERKKREGGGSAGGGADLVSTPDGDDKDDTVDRLWKPPADVDFQSESNDTTDHSYYVMTTYTNNTEQTNKHWVDVDALLAQKGVTGNKSHPLLSNSYRRAVGAKISFDFAFYGHKMSNLTIATGGFCYIGDQTHSWLAATQYIAPLMANFDTQLDGANILYADDGEKFVVEWRKVQLRQQRNYGPFTFQAVLYKNGNIAFVYKDVPMNVANISDAHHPCKLGISDAYLFHHSALAMSKRVIYEYHRIEVAPSRVTSNTVVFLAAQPTCMSLATCAECSNSTLKHFNCSWCHAKKKHGGPFCTDQAGLHRRRQQWIEGNCKDQQKTIYCPSGEEDVELEDADEETTTDSAGAPGPSSTAAPSTAPETVVPLDAGGRSGAASLDSEKASSSTGSMLLFLVLSLGVALIGWAAYAYYNPHTPSGQLLIKYRPGHWHVPSSHVRYSASVHM